MEPPSSIPNFNEPYPLGFQGNQICPVTDGTDYAVDKYGVSDIEWLKWIMWLVVVAYWFIFTTITYFALRYSNLFHALANINVKY